MPTKICLKWSKFKIKKNSGLSAECQNSLGPEQVQQVWAQIRPDILSGLIWTQTVCKGKSGHKQEKSSGNKR